MPFQLTIMAAAYNKYGLECSKPTTPPPPYSPDPLPQYHPPPAMAAQSERHIFSSSSVPRLFKLSLRSSGSKEAPISPLPPHEPSLDFFTGPLETPKVRTFIKHWDTVVSNCQPSNFQHLVVSQVSLMKQYMKGFQHEFIQMRVVNKISGDIYALVAQRDLSSSGDQKTKGRAIDEVYILSTQESSRFSGITLRTMTWRTEFDSAPPFLVDVFHLLCRTSEVLTDQYTATNLNCYRFAIVAFCAIEQFRSDVKHGISTHKQYKQSSILGVELVNKDQVYRDITRVLVLFFEQKLSSSSKGGVQVINKGKGKAADDSE
ncbi:hypothetical protein HD554DRAFT_2086681 [Boletus coccyginus]|nr:hypothetical protein HD554DRAFT_2086681 [Boletus coccyginus]